MHQVAFCTKHHKTAIIAPLLQSLGFKLVEYAAFDTDSLGTFSGECPRTLTPDEAALEKAKQACQATSMRYGLGSEGSFGGGPYPGFVNWNHELLCLYDSHSEQIIYASAQGPTSLEPMVFESFAELSRTLILLGEQRWILNVENQLNKGQTLASLSQLEDNNTLTYPVTLEPDFRAMYCPERQQMIHKAGADLVKRLAATCPACQAPNFVVKATETGLTCSHCHYPTQQVKSETYHCDMCHHESIQTHPDFSADPAQCGVCNP